MQANPCGNIAFKTAYAGGATATTAYNSLGQMTNQVDPDGVVNLYLYN
jgi:YD repeat-containing protein